MFIDIAVNITDKQFSGSKDTVREVMERSRESKVMPILIGLDRISSRACMDIAREYGTVSTVGIHPTESSRYSSVDDLIPLIDDDTVVAIGECGLDYDRLMLADKESQRRLFRAQLDLDGDCYFLHSRACHRDFMEMVCDYRIRGVVHSFTGTLEEAEELIRKGYFIGVNGCSVKTADGIETLRNLPLESLLIETDSPYCRIRKSYAGFEHINTDPKEPKVLKKRNEPCCVMQMAEVISNVTGKEYDTVVKTVLDNTLSLYGSKPRGLMAGWE